MSKVVYECSECGDKHSKWQGKCNSCGSWNSLVETVAENPKTTRYTGLNQASNVVNLTHVDAQDVSRQKTGVQELDRVLGGGLAIGSVILIGGDPGIG